MAHITINKDKRHQTMESFGVSGAWWAQIVGGWAEADEASGESKRDRIAELLCDKDRGIGIGCYRYNLGGGSDNDGKGVFRQKSRGTVSFDTGEDEYDWDRDKNAVYMMKKCVEEGADEVVIFSNSPPVRWTKNHKACLDRPWHTNLPVKNEQKFVRYLLDCAEHFKAEGIPVKYISPVNEPVWVWTERHGQEGCHYNPTGVRRLMHKLAVSLGRREALAGVKISGAENGDIRWFNRTYCRVMLGDKVIRRNIDGIDTHSYFTQLPIPIVKKPVNDRLAFMMRYRKFMDRHYPGVRLKISEWTHMQGGRDYGIDSALVQAKTMYEDLTVLDAASWQNWIAVSDVDFCDGLIYINDDRSFELTKRYYAFGNFSKFVNREDVRAEAVCDDSEVLPLFFMGGGSDKLIVINLSFSTKDIQLPAVFAAGTLYVTSADDDLTPSVFTGPDVTVKARSVTTFIAGGRDNDIG